jgi:hypothetical protein
MDNVQKVNNWTPIISSLLVQMFSSSPSSKTHSVYVLSLCQRPSFTPIQKYSQNYSFILIFTFFDSRREDQWFWTEWQQAISEFNLLRFSHSSFQAWTGLHHTTFSMHGLLSLSPAWLTDFLIPKTEIYSSKMSGSIKISRHYNPEDHTLQKRSS